VNGPRVVLCSFVLSACAAQIEGHRSGPATDRVATVLPSDDVRLDDLPQYECPPPPDDAIIVAMSRSESLDSFADPAYGFWWGTFKLASFVDDEGSFPLSGLATNEVTDEYKVTLYTSAGESDPLTWQGEYALIGDNAQWEFYEMTVEWNVGGVHDYAFSDAGQSNLPDSRLCVSHRRPDRMAGTGWFGPNEGPDDGIIRADPAVDEDAWPAIWFTFNNADPAISIWPDGGGPPYYLYTDDWHSLMSLRISTTMYTEYYKTTPEEVWSYLAEDDR